MEDFEENNRYYLIKVYENNQDVFKKSLFIIQFIIMCFYMLSILNKLKTRKVVKLKEKASYLSLRIKL